MLARRLLELRDQESMIGTWPENKYHAAVRTYLATGRLTTQGVTHRTTHKNEEMSGRDLGHAETGMPNNTHLAELPGDSSRSVCSRVSTCRLLPSSPKFSHPLMNQWILWGVITYI